MSPSFLRTAPREEAAHRVLLPTGCRHHGRDRGAFGALQQLDDQGLLEAGLAAARGGNGFLAGIFGGGRLIFGRLLVALVVLDRNRLEAALGDPQRHRTLIVTPALHREIAPPADLLDQAVIDQFGDQLLRGTAP